MRQKRFSDRFGLFSRRTEMVLAILTLIFCGTATAETEEISSMRRLITEQQRQLEQQKEQIESQSVLLKKLLQQVAEIQSNLSAGSTTVETANPKTSLSVTTPTTPQQKVRRRCKSPIS